MKKILLKTILLFVVIFGFANYDSLIAQNPIITGITPNNAYLGQGGLSVTISGQNTHFSQGTSTSSTIWFSQGTKTLYPNAVYPQSSIGINAYFYISNTVSTGLWNVNVHNNIDGLMTLPNAMTINSVPVPQILSVSPNSAIVNQTLTVSITAQNTSFGQGTSTTTAWFEQGSSTFLPITNIIVLNSTEFSGQVNIPSNTPLGNYNTWVNNTIDGQLYKPNSFEVLGRPLCLDSLSPFWGRLNEQHTYTLFGHLTHFTDPSLTILFKNHTDILLTKQVTNIIVINDSVVQFDCKIDIGQSNDLWDLYTLSFTDGALTLASAYTVSPVPISIDEFGKDFNVQLFPNPSNNIVNIRSAEITNTKVDMSIYSSSGVLLYTESYNVSKSLDKKIDISDFSKGVYFVQLSFDGNILYQKLLKN